MVYTRFVEYLKQVVGTAKVNQLTHHNAIFSTYGVHFSLKGFFEDFLKGDPQALNTMKSLKWQFYPPKNSCDGDLYFPVETTDEEDMVSSGIRKNAVEPREQSIWMKDKELEFISPKMRKMSPKGALFPIKKRREGKLKVYLKNNEKNKYFKTTYAIYCSEDEQGSQLKEFLELKRIKPHFIKKTEWTKV